MRGGGVALLDDRKETGTRVLHSEVKGRLADCIKEQESALFLIGIGDNTARRKIDEKYPLHYLTLIHPSVVIGSDVKIGEGTVVMAGAVINSGSRIGRHCIINTGATVDHDCVIQDFVHISPGAHLGGSVEVGDGSWIGIGACVKNNLTICENSTIGTGAAVVDDITESGIYVGVPARRMK